MNMRQADLSVQKTSTVDQPASRSDYALQYSQKLPTGAWKIAITKGDAWVFTNVQDIILHTNDQLDIHNEDGSATIRSLYTRGSAQFTLSALDN